MSDIEAQAATNRASWDAATAAHNSHKRDQAGFLRAGGSTLFPEELELLGPLEGLRLLHLQCNAGQDSLSLVAQGAEVVGVDFSEVAIAAATQLSADSGLPARFERADVFDWLPAATPEAFDVVFSSYGAVCWLRDLGAWAQGIARVLRPGGRLVLMEFHPAAMMFDEQLTLKYSYFGGAPLRWDDGVGDYVARSGDALTPMGRVDGVVDFVNPHPVYEHQWCLGDILGAVLAAGLRLERFDEHAHSNGCSFYDGSPVDAQRRFTVPPGAPSVPQMFGLVASKPR